MVESAFANGNTPEEDPPASTHSEEPGPRETTLRTPLEHGLPFDKLAIVQLNSKTGAIEENTDRAIRLTNQAAEKGAELIVLTEASLTGYCCQDLFERDDFVIAGRKALDRFAAETSGATSVIGFIDIDESRKNRDGTARKYNAVAFIQDGKVKGIRHKQNLPTYGVFDDQRHFSEGQSNEPVNAVINGKPVKLGLLVCEDMWDEEYSRKVVRGLKEQGAEMLLVVNASPEESGKYERRDSIIRKHVENSGLFFAYANATGAVDIGKNIIALGGESTVYSPEGTLIALGPAYREDTLHVNLRQSRRTPVTRSRPTWENRTWDLLTSTLHDYCGKIGFQKIVVPVSGGVDSNLGAALATAAIGPENVTLVTMPTKFNSSQTIGFAEQVAGNLGVKQFYNLPIQDAYETFQQGYEKHIKPIDRSPGRVTLENFQPRIRATYMMAYANEEHALLLSCGNKTEVGLGYVTLYGDTAGGVSLLGDISKYPYIYRLAHHANVHYDREVIPVASIDQTPSAELAEGQTDPFDYVLASPVIVEFTDRRRTASAIIQDFKDQRLDRRIWIPYSDGSTVLDRYQLGDFSDRIYRLAASFSRNAHKRLQSPPVFKVNPISFGFDYREPIVNGWGAK